MRKVSHGGGLMLKHLRRHKAMGSRDSIFFHTLTWPRAVVWSERTTAPFTKHGTIVLIILGADAFFFLLARGYASDSANSMCDGCSPSELDAELGTNSAGTVGGERSAGKSRDSPAG